MALTIKVSSPAKNQFLRSARTDREQICRTIVRWIIRATEQQLCSLLLLGARQAPHDFFSKHNYDFHKLGQIATASSITERVTSSLECNSVHAQLAMNLHVRFVPVSTCVSTASVVSLC